MSENINQDGVIKKSIRKINSIRQQGVLLFVRITIDRIALHALRQIYGFHPWHADAPLSARPYRRTLANMVNKLNPNCVVEVGCGLGVTLELIQAQQRWGYDHDAGAIRAGRLLRDKAIKFIEGNLSNVEQDSINVLILVNWIHEYSPEELYAWLKPLLPRTNYLILDAIDLDNDSNYKYKHDFKFLAGHSLCIESVKPENEGRQFHLYKVIR